MKIAAVIVTFNRLRMLQAVLPHTLKQDFDHVVIVDNASTDGTGLFLSKVEDQRVSVITLPENAGGAGGFHKGVEFAQNIADWLVLYDDDSWPMDGCVDNFRALTVSDDIGALSAVVRYPDGRVCEMNRQGLNPFWHPGTLFRSLTRSSSGRSGFKLTNDQLQARTDTDVDNASFVGFFLRAEAAKRDGLPNPDLFIYGDDVLYCLMLRRCGWRIVVTPALGFIHDCGTMGEGFTYNPLWKVYYHCRNGVLIAQAAAGRLVYPLALMYYVSIWWRRGRNATDKSVYYKLMRMGLRDGLRGRFGRCEQAHALSDLARKSGKQ